MRFHIAYISLLTPQTKEVTVMDILIIEDKVFNQKEAFRRYDESGFDREESSTGLYHSRYPSFESVSMPPHPFEIEVPEEGVKVTVTSSLEDGLKALEEKLWAYVVIDIGMPASISEKSRQEYDQKLYELAKQANSTALTATGLLSDHEIHSEGEFALDTEDYNPQEDWKGMPPYGVLAVNKAKDKGLEVTVFTSDFGHARHGVKLLAGLDLVDPVTVARLVATETTDTRSDGNIRMADDLSFALGLKAEKNFEMLLASISEVS